MVKMDNYQKLWDKEDRKHYLKNYGEDYKNIYLWRKIHGDLKELNLRYCNACGFETSWDKDGCEFHKNNFEEFNQDGEEW